MRSLIAAIAACVMLCAPAFAIDIPSAASGMYLTPDRVCRVELSRFQDSWIRNDLTCLSFTGALSNSRTILYAPGSCWNSQVTVAFNPQAWDEFVALRFYSHAGGTLTVVRGSDQTSVANGIGIAETWNRIATVQSPAPYSCAPAAVSNKPRG